MQYAYKFVSFPVKLGFDYAKKVHALEQQWNELGQQGWKFCTQGNGFIVFMREIPAADTPK